MSDQINNNVDVSSVMKELFDIKSNLAVNSNETQNIKVLIAEIKTDIKIIKNDFVNRRELSEILSGTKEKVDLLVAEQSDLEVRLNLKSEKSGLELLRGDFEVVRNKVYVFMGAVAVITILLQLFGPYLIKKL